MELEASGEVLRITLLVRPLHIYSTEYATDAPSGVGDAPAHITAEMSIPERLKLYSAGGCLFVTTRILVRWKCLAWAVRNHCLAEHTQGRLQSKIPWVL